MPLIYPSGQPFVEWPTAVLVIADGASSRFPNPGLAALRLTQDYPNPFNRQTLISFVLRTGDEAGTTQLQLLNGRVIRTRLHHVGDVP